MYVFKFARCAPRCCARLVPRNLHVIPAFMHTLPRIILAFRYVVSTLFQRATHYFRADMYIYVRLMKSNKNKKERGWINKNDTFRRSLKHFISRLGKIATNLHFSLADK